MNDEERKRELARGVEDLVNQEKALRKHLGIGERYKAISSRLEALRQYVQAAVGAPKQAVTAEDVCLTLTHEQCYVFVHLFNAKGKTLSRWEAMLSPRQLSEYSVNRPIYAQQGQVEAYIRSRSNDDEHAFLIMKVEKTDILCGSAVTDNHDPLGHILLKLKEGALKPASLVYFFHKRDCYSLLGGHLVLLEKQTQ